MFKTCLKNAKIFRIFFWKNVKNVLEKAKKCKKKVKMQKNVKNIEIHRMFWIGIDMMFYLDCLAD